MLLHRKFAVIHFNNGLHGIGYTEEQYKAGYEKALQLIREIQPEAKIIAALSTPLKEGSPKAPLNPRIDKRNADVTVLAQAAGVAVHDLNTLMRGHPEYHSDPYHYGAKGVAIQASAVASLIKTSIAISADDKK